MSASGAVATHPAFIGGLADLVKAALAKDAAMQNGAGDLWCANARRCACKGAA